MTLRERCLAFLRVPPPPSAPPGDEDVRVFRAAPNYFRYRVITWLGTQVGAAVGLVFGVLVITNRMSLSVPPGVSVGPITISQPTLELLIVLGEVVAIAGFFAELIVSGALLRLDFEQRWYMVSDRSLRIREGLIRIQEKTMTYANVQHVAMRQNPVHRWLGIADLEVRTAGGGSAPQQNAPDQHVGYLRGLSNAAQVRDAIQERLRRRTDAGLGDPDDADRGAAEPGGPAPGDMLTAALALRDAARAVRDEVAVRSRADR